MGALMNNFETQCRISQNGVGECLNSMMDLPMSRQISGKPSSEHSPKRYNEHFVRANIPHPKGENEEFEIDN